MKNKLKLKLIAMIAILPILLVGCNDKSTTIGEYHKMEFEDLTEIHIMPHDNMTNTKSFLQVQSQEIQDIYEFILKIQPEKSDVLNEENTLSDPDFSILLQLKENGYSVAVGENYIVVVLNKVYETIEEITKNTTIHMVNKEVINEFENMLNKLIMES